ncbi:unnamed protein product [Paramecium sonneborni]|uniref:Uncharacterized protein n=1 Tax=Paramecium sonneborni TaxID=65129 RepID=A0A8S1R3F6_9CILI|nr:unnamed protein product [Paramecium sonneborni]
MRIRRSIKIVNQIQNYYQPLQFIIRMRGTKRMVQTKSVQASSQELQKTSLLKNISNVQHTTTPPPLQQNCIPPLPVQSICLPLSKSMCIPLPPPPPQKICTSSQPPLKPQQKTVPQEQCFIPQQKSLGFHQDRDVLNQKKQIFSINNLPNQINQAPNN